MSDDRVPPRARGQRAHDPHSQSTEDTMQHRETRDPRSRACSASQSDDSTAITRRSTSPFEPPAFSLASPNGSAASASAASPLSDAAARAAVASTAAAAARRVSRERAASVSARGSPRRNAAAAYARHTRVGCHRMSSGWRPFFRLGRSIKRTARGVLPRGSRRGRPSSDAAQARSRRSSATPQMRGSTSGPSA